MDAGNILAHNTAELLKMIRAQQERIKALSWNPELDMYNGAGIRDAIGRLAQARYIVTYFDIDHLKRINSATRSHVLTNRYLRDGLRVRKGELIGQLYGDEFLAIVRQYSRFAQVRADAFVARLARQLAAQPVALSATFATAIGVAQPDILPMLDTLSRDVLAQKEARDALEVQL